MTVTRRKDTRTPRVFMHKTADIRGGVSVKVSELGGDFSERGRSIERTRQRHLPRCEDCRSVGRSDRNRN